MRLDLKGGVRPTKAVSVLVTTVPGLEDYVVMEVEERMGTKVGHVYDRMSGRVLLEAGGFPLNDDCQVLPGKHEDNRECLLPAGQGGEVGGPLMEDLEGRAKSLRLEGAAGGSPPRRPA